MKVQEISAVFTLAGSLVLLAMVAQQGVVNAIPTDSGSISSADYPLPASLHQTLISCPFSAGGDDKLSRGFYVQSYPGTNLGTVQVTYWTGVAGSYSVSMTARDGTYDGPMIGTTRIVTVDLPASTYITATFDFGGASVIPGTTVTFSQAKVSGPGSAYYNTGPCGLDLDCTTCSGVYQTWGTAPPLDTIRRRSVAVTIAQIPPYYWSYLPLVMR